MPLNPKTQARLGEMGRRVLVELEPIGSSPHQKSIVEMVERHLLGLINALNQLDSHLEERVVHGIRQYLDDYEKGKPKAEAVQPEKESREEKKPLERGKKSATGKK